MIEVAQFAILRPWWIAALPVIALASWFAARRAIGLAAWERAVDPLLMGALRQLGAVVPGAGRRLWTLPVMAAAIAVALAGPATQTGDLTAFRNLDGLVLAIDLSPSVTRSGNLAMALSAARLVAERAGSRPIALVVFGDDAYEASGFTIDARALGTTIAVLDAETVPGAGSRPERALALAQKLLGESRTVAGDVVLVSDGGGLGDDALAQARAMAKVGARLSALFVPGAIGNGAPPDNRAGLLALTQAGNGVLADVADPAPVADIAAVSASTRLAATDYAVLAWTDHGRLLLLIAALAALLPFRRRRLHA